MKPLNYKVNYDLKDHNEKWMNYTCNIVSYSSGSISMMLFNIYGRNNIKINSCMDISTVDGFTNDVINNILLNNLDIIKRIEADKQKENDLTQDNLHSLIDKAKESEIKRSNDFKETINQPFSMADYE